VGSRDLNQNLAIAAVVKTSMADWKPFDRDLSLAAVFPSRSIIQKWINAFYEKSLVRFGGNAERMAPYVIAGTFIEKDKSISDRD
jgi:hypothetical protein